MEQKNIEFNTEYYKTENRVWSCKEERRQLKEVKKKYKEEKKRVDKESNRYNPTWKKVAVTGVVCSLMGGVLSCVLTLSFIGISINHFKADILKLKPEVVYIEREVTGEIKSYESLGSAVYEKSSPSIVGIEVNSSPYESIWGTVEQISVEATGVIYSEDGYIITNYVAIQKALSSKGYLESDSNIRVFINDLGVIDEDIQIVGYNINADIAVLKLDVKGLRRMEMGDSDTVKTGQNVFSLGCNSGMNEEFPGVAIKEGIVCDLNKTIYTEKSKDIHLIQTSAVLETESYGGALFDDQGKMIGFTSSLVTSQSSSNMSCSIPSGKLIEICEDILAESTNNDEPLIGITASESVSDGEPEGVRIEKTEINGAAALAGLKKGDIILKFNGEDTPDYESLNEKKNKFNKGDRVTVTYYRTNEIKEAELTLK